jgi:hypothetical protein
VPEREQVAAFEDETAHDAREHDDGTDELNHVVRLL